jgi:hypothetical protein
VAVTATNHDPAAADSFHGIRLPSATFLHLLPGKWHTPLADAASEPNLRSRTADEPMAMEKPGDIGVDE